jgi:Pentapeptide repeats (8 copies)
MSTRSVEPSGAGDSGPPQGPPPRPEPTSNRVRDRTALLFLAVLIIFIAATWDVPVTQEVVDVTPWRLAVLALVALAVVVLAPGIQARAAGLSAPETYQRETQCRDAWLKVIAGLFAVLAAFDTLRKFRLDQEIKITDQYAKAVAQLEGGPSKSLTTRLSGIYTFEQIAQDPQYYVPVTELLTTYIRRTSLPSTDINNPGLDAPEAEAIIRVLARLRSRPHRWKAPPIDLHEMTLANLDLSHIDLRGAILRSANLGGARLLDAHLDGADLTSASLIDADLRNATMDGTILDTTLLAGATLAQVDLSRTKGLRWAQLRDVSVYDAERLPDTVKKERAQLASSPPPPASPSTVPPPKMK